MNMSAVPPGRFLDFDTLFHTKYFIFIFSFICSHQTPAVLTIDCVFTLHSFGGACASCDRNLD